MKTNQDVEKNLARKPHPLLISIHGFSMVQTMVVLSLTVAVAAAVTGQISMSSDMVSIINSRLDDLSRNSQLATHLIDSDLLKRSLEANEKISSCWDALGSCPPSDQLLPLVLLDDDANPLQLLNNTYYFQVICPPQICSDNGLVKVTGKSIKTRTLASSGNGAPIELPGLARFIGLGPAPSLSVPGLFLSMRAIGYRTIDGRINAIGENRWGFIENTNISSFISSTQPIKDFNGNIIFSKSYGGDGSAHGMLVRQDGTVWTVGRNDHADLAQPGTSTIESFRRDIFIYDYDASGEYQVRPSPAISLPMSLTTPYEVNGWRSVSGPLGDPAVANVEKAVAAKSAFNLAIRENGEVWGAGLNRNNRMGFPLLELGPQTYVDPYGVTQPHLYFLGERFEDGTVPDMASSSADFAAILGQFQAVVRNGGSSGFESITHPKYTPGPTSTPGYVLEFKKSFYLGADVGFELVDSTFGHFHGCAVNQHANVVCWGSAFKGILGRGTLRADIEWDAATSAAWLPGLSGPEKRTAKYLFGIRFGANPVPTGVFHSPWKTPGGIPAGLGAPPSAFHNVVTDHLQTPLGGIVSISGQARHACALQNTGMVFCWGDNVNGQLGRGEVCNETSTTGAYQGFTGSCKDIDIAKPVLNASGVPITNAVKVLASRDRTFILTDDGKIYGAGYQSGPGGRYHLGVSTSSGVFDRAVEFTTASTFGYVVDIATTGRGVGQASCLLNDKNELWCWGTNKYTSTSTGIFSPTGDEFYVPTKVTNGINL